MRTLLRLSKGAEGLHMEPLACSKQRMSAACAGLGFLQYLTNMGSVLLFFPTKRTPASAWERPRWTSKWGFPTICGPPLLSFRSWFEHRMCGPLVLHKLDDGTMCSSLLSYKKEHQLLHGEALVRLQKVDFRLYVVCLCRPPKPGEKQETKPDGNPPLPCLHPRRQKVRVQPTYADLPQYSRHTEDLHFMCGASSCLH
jgi:hypothetical protein